jgi:hypothetical protein
MAAYKSYVDDSGDAEDPSHSACSIAGFLGTVDQWTEFESQWAILLAHFRIPYLHMREFAHHLPPFDHLTGDERENVLHLFIQTIKRCNLAGFGAVVRLPDLKRFNRERSRQLEALPLALYACMNDIYNADPWREVDITLDRFAKPVSVLAKAKEYAATHWSSDVSQMMIWHHLKNAESFRTVLPLQAADFIAYEIKKNIESRREWLDEAMDDDPETWGENERQWLASRGLPYPRLRRSLAGLLDNIPVSAPVWDYRILCDLDERRGGKWRKRP